MAERRMFAREIIDSDPFLDMPLSSQALYFHLGMNADDDGFINNPKRIIRTIGCSNDDFKLLIAKRFVIIFDSGVMAVSYTHLDVYKRQIQFCVILDKACNSSIQFHHLLFVLVRIVFFLKMCIRDRH